MSCPFHPPWLQHSNYILWRVKVLKLSIMQFSTTIITSSLFSPNILCINLFSNIFSLYYSLTVRYQVLHPHKTTGKISFVYFNFYVFRQ
jgi:hypothetical protein